MKKIPITVFVSKTVPENVWRDALAKLGEMQKSAIARGIGLDWKCEFQHEEGVFFVAQKDMEFMIHRDGDEPQHIRHGHRIKATACAEDPAANTGPAKKPEAVLKDYRSEVIREMKRLAVSNSSQRKEHWMKSARNLRRITRTPSGWGSWARCPRTTPHVTSLIRCENQTETKGMATQLQWDNKLSNPTGIMQVKSECVSDDRGVPGQVAGGGMKCPVIVFPASGIFNQQTTKGLCRCLK